MMDELRSHAGDGCFTPGIGVDLDLVLLRGIGTEADYTDLPDGILGRTCFSPDGSVRIEISRALSDRAEKDPVERRRLRTTLAHESGHVACHRCLYVRDVDTLSLFPTSRAQLGQPPAPIMCREEAIRHSTYRGQWWEYQANQCMACLLLPQKLVAESVSRLLGIHGLQSFGEGVQQGLGEALLEKVSNEYDVSLTATLYRLQALGFVPSGSQLRLELNS